MSSEKWKKEHLVRLQVKLNKRTDADILHWLEGRAYATEIKAALRERIERNNKEEND